MAKSTIYTANTASQELAIGSAVDLGNTMRRFGCNLRQNGNAINVNGAGYYGINVNLTVTGTTVGTAVFTVFKDGVAVTGATATATLEVGTITTIGINAVIREYGCCMDNNSNITVVLSGIPATINNVAISAERL